MKSETFNSIVENQIELCNHILIKKAEEYATEDRLHNFKVAAKMQGITPKQALAGMMAKHTVSIYDMCESPATFTTELWNEKITDHLNYLLLLAATVREELSEMTTVDTEIDAPIGVHTVINNVGGFNYSDIVKDVY